MYKINNKNILYNNLLIRCVQGIHNIDLKQKVYKNVGNFIRRSEKYEELGKGGELYKINNSLNDGFSQENMLFLYNKLRDSKHSRSYYDKIMSSSPICPYCGVQVSSTLDHYLPKSEFPMYAVDPYNLLPSCFECNNLKGEHTQNQGNETFHPYFDYDEDLRFLKVEIFNFDNNVSFNFYLDFPIGMKKSTSKKIENHYKLLKLSRLYSVLASSEVHSQIFQFKELFKKGGKSALRENLEDIFNSNLEANLNSWKTALYEGMKDSDWFCEEGIWLFKYTVAENESMEVEELLPIPKYE